ncbi:hypothetical protein [Ligilactobacillus salivarius]|uniref:hypothetical protein n=1 Tax=Ligilactobacillus salivarius TaxID=1624 RepID=UPI0031E55912
MESMTSPIIKVYLTDAQFKELKQDLLDKFSVDLVNNLIDERIQQEQAPYLNKKEFAQWAGYAPNTINKFIADGLPVATIGTIKAIGKQSYIDFMRQHER